MTWTATAVSSTPISPVDIVEMYAVSVRFDSDDGQPSTTRIFRLSTKAQLVNAIKNQLATFNGIDLGSLALDAIDVSPPPPAPPTPADLAAQAYAQKRQVLVTVKQDFDLGLVTQAALDQALADAKAAKV